MSESIWLLQDSPIFWFTKTLVPPAPTPTCATSYHFLWAGEDLSGDILPEQAAKIAHGDRRFMPRD